PSDPKRHKPLQSLIKLSRRQGPGLIPSIASHASPSSTVLTLTIVNQDRVFDVCQLGEEFPPELAFTRRAISPEAVMNDGVVRFDSNSNQVVKILVGQALDVQVNGCTLNRHSCGADDVDLFLSDFRLADQSASANPQAISKL
ncbi:MAG: hypothetical protein ACLQVY_25270, partial [Limisphaerales bacterium]